MEATCQRDLTALVSFRSSLVLKLVLTSQIVLLNSSTVQRSCLRLTRCLSRQRQGMVDSKDSVSIAIALREVSTTLRSALLKCLLRIQNSTSWTRWQSISIAWTLVFRSQNYSHRSDAHLKMVLKHLFADRLTTPQWSLLNASACRQMFKCAAASWP